MCIVIDTEKRLPAGHPAIEPVFLDLPVHLWGSIKMILRFFFTSHQGFSMLDAQLIKIPGHPKHLPFKIMEATVPLGTSNAILV